VTPRSVREIKTFQQALHLDIPSVTDGIVGPVTWQALVSGMLSF
jgi:peptidoglycan hydrolase-like protein with peptidoglycan-binding domain